MRSLAGPLLAACALAWALALGVGAVAGERARPDAAIVATTTQAADIARAVAGNRVRVSALVAANTDPHDHEVRPGDVAAVRAADVLVRSGGEVDHWIEDVEAAAGGDARVVELLGAVDPLGSDPHFWQDPRAIAAAAERVRAALTAADPDGADAYARNARAYAERLDALDRDIAACWERVPAAQRKLVTTHDAYGYYARRYGLTVTGSVVGSLSSRGQPSARTLARLIDRLRAEDIRAIFTEEALNPSVEEAVAREAGVRTGTLQGDALAPRQTLLDALRADTRAMTGALTDERCP